MKTFIGIDPGVNTGICVLTQGNISLLATTDFWHAVDTIKQAKKITEGAIELTVVIEDPSQNKPTFDRSVEGQKRQSRISQNVGSNKREAQLLIEFCRRNGITVLPVRPTKKSLTKLSAEQFTKITGYTGRTSEHARDAAMLVWGMR